MDKSAQGESHRGLIKSVSIVSLGTLSSRILGFLRDVILARFLGTGFKADAFFVAQKIPNLFRDLVGEGATNSAFVPVFSEYVHTRSKKELLEFISVIFILGLMVLSAITVLGIWLAPWVVKLIAPGFVVEPEKLELTVRLTRIIFPYLILIGLTAYGMAVLYTFKSFVVPAFSPCLLNIALIISAVISFYTMEEPEYGLAIGVLVGGVLQLLAHFRPIMKMGIRFVKPASLNHKGALQVGRLLLPRILGSGVYQLAVFIDTFCASLSFVVGAGGISAIYYANRVIQFPMGIFTFAMASAVLPTLSELATKNDLPRFRKTLIFALENIFFVMFPTSILTMILARPIVRVLFERGEFNPYSTEVTAMALMAYCIGLFSFGAIKIMVTAFHSLQDTKTPVKVAALCLCINTALNFILMYPFLVGGIALASSIAGTVDFMILFFVMDKRLGDMRQEMARYVSKIFIATFLTGLVVFYTWEKWAYPSEFIKLMAVGCLGLLAYGIATYVLKVQQAQKICLWATGRMK
ncbi:MAG: murein biosynthesis integral membrane protein MurJ [Omnitrophica WOR_2 bacterium GWA2_47_8]|nr:MAG: murein biosynthesis integral membrane protein MurJ [Omnitrophica WOR_2 bacterium GWA2_47_8]